MVSLRVAALALTVSSSLAFVPLSFVKHGAATQSARNLMDPSMMDAGMIESTASVLPNIMASSFESVSNTLAFSDQGQNLAGIFFQASLLPYLAFLYFLAYKGNRINPVGNFGFQFILLFVISTIPAGIVSKLTYGTSLANVDWLHGGAELLLTTANILIVLGFKEAAAGNPPPKNLPRLTALGLFGLFIAALATGPSLGVETHSPFLLGVGDLSPEMTTSLPWVSHPEPENALSIPTWIIHFSSVIEYIVAMDAVWKYSEATGNEKWKGLTWGMLPLNVSGLCACTYHFFYNASALQFLVSMQAGTTLLGNLTCAIAAYRIAKSNGWTLSEANPLSKSEPDTVSMGDSLAAMPLTVVEQEESTPIVLGKVFAATIFLSYLVKYGELGLDLPFEPNGPVALGVVLGLPSLLGYSFYKRSQEEGGEGLSLPFMGENNNLSMDDVKKYGVAGTVAYVLTELAFWIVAFPVAATALYQSTGHWPDVVNETTDRAAVLAFIFAGANVARAFVPLRLGAALALAPWVDENLLSRGEEAS